LWLADQDAPTLHGKEVLQDLVHNHQDEYNKLTSQEQKDLICEFEEYKAMKVKGFGVSTKARINDVTQTLSAVENKVFIFILRSQKETGTNTSVAQ
jgi:hypothetical protein